MNILLDLNAFRAYLGEYWAYGIILIAGLLPTEIWRLAAVFLSSSLNENDEIIIFVRHVATALLMAVVAKMVILPTGALASVSLLARGLSFTAATLSFLLLGRSILIAILCGESIFMALIWFGF